MAETLAPSDAVLDPALVQMSSAHVPMTVVGSRAGVRRGAGSVVVTGAAATSAFGRGVEPLMAAVLEGRPGFGPVARFEVGGRRVKVAAMMPGAPVLAEELAWAVGEACDAAGLGAAERGGCALFLAVHGDPGLARASGADKCPHGADVFAGEVAVRSGLSGVVRAYTSACVASATAVADAAALIARGRASRIVVAAGYLVDADQFALFDAGRALAVDGRVRPFSAGRSGLLLGDGVGAVVLEAGGGAAGGSSGGRAVQSVHRTRTRTRMLGRIAGWGRAGDAYHVCRPRPDGAGLARAIAAALERGGLRAEDVGYVNAHGSGTAHSDEAEAAALHLALGEWGGAVPVSSTKSVHGQALEAGGLLELIVTLHALRAGLLPVNAGYLGVDGACRLNLVLEPGAVTGAGYALSVNSAFGGANTALLVGAP